MNFFSKLILLTLFLGCVIAGCSEDPASVGTKLIPGSEKFSAHDTSIIAIRDTTFKFAGPNGGGASMLVGNYSSVEARALLQFFTSIPDSLTTVHIDTVKLSLTVSYTWNMGATPAEFVIRKVTTPWSSTTVTVDSLARFHFAPTLSASITDKDTISIGRVVTALFDSSIIRQWINITADGSKPLFFSIALVPKPGMTNTGIWGFYQFGTSTPPSLKILYSKNGVRDSIDLNSGSGTFLATKTPFLPSGFIETQAGISIRSKINFNLKPISDSISRAIVNNATMELTLDTSASRLGAGTPDSVLALIGGSDARPDSVSTAYFAFGYRKDASQTSNIVYTFNVTSMAQQWINNPSTYQGVVLRSIIDESSVDKLSFYSSKDLTRAPRLSVTYTKK
jgi:hypothetical protein